MDFWNDGEYVQVASLRTQVSAYQRQRRYRAMLFIHYSDSKIHEKMLLKALQSPLFIQYHKNQPFNDNHLRPCPLLDNPAD